ncbi:pyridoxamine 5'-phosphate oxidase family protein [Actinoplanes flavus]|uniref:Pyridoxamine 5'-phosphate oxidase family protein n=1 Tax=Actinoplanes flavus TaxID=2820290 RepID=A0ABS3UZG4_9ACTN|nr:pyridoxamine 5'-phosphate oxidase family protein [Actinoplanes flavus]MBO3743974.1 pyridoxamine 5'-phosphate oxidase family protein [Actinoplanes flavus]
MTADEAWLAEVQARSFDRATPATTSSFPAENRMSGAQLAVMLHPGAYGVLATTRVDGRPHAAPTSLVLQDEAVWFPTISGAVRLANLAVHPWASLVVMRGDGSDHAVVMLEGPAEVMDSAAAEVASAAARYGREPAWATAWIRMTPEKILSYAASPDAELFRRR